MKRVCFGLPLILLMVSCNGNRTENTTTTTSTTDTTVTTPAPAPGPDTAAMRKERDEYRFNAQQELNKQQARIDSLDAAIKSKKGTAKMKSDWQKEKADIQARIDRIHNDLHVYGNRVDNTWDTFRTKLRTNLDSLQAAWDRTIHKSPPTDTITTTKTKVKTKVKVR